MIPAKTIQDIMDATRIEDVVGEFVNLRRRGVNLIGLCPFHGEKTPSFNVNPPRNVFKCFGCGKAGDSISFLREHERMSYVEALHWLARKYGITVEEIQRTPEQVAEMQFTDSLYIVNDFAQKNYSESLFNSDEGKSVALSYFKKRGLRDDTIEKFGLGYASENPRDWLLQKAKSGGYSMDLLKKLGLSNQTADRDFFRARVIFPIHNLSGKVAAFAGRTMSSDKTIPKYINSPESEIYVKNKTLYGAFQAKKAIRQFDECILTEGYMDVISLHQAGIENAVASSGTSLTEGQLQLIKRNTDNLRILYDGDPAGIKAALRGLDLALEQDLNVKICLLPKDEDPDSYVQKVGTEAFKEYMARESKDFILFKTSLLLEETKGDPLKRSSLLKDIVSSIAKIPDPIKRSVYLKECSALMAISEEILVSESNKIITTILKKREEKGARAPGAASDSMPRKQADLPQNPNFPDAEYWPSEELSPPSEGGFPEGHEAAPQRVSAKSSKDKPELRADEFQERDIVRLLVQFGHQVLDNEQITVAEYLLGDIEESLGNFDNPLYGRIAKLCYDRLVEGETLPPDFFLKHEQTQISELAIDLVTQAWDYSPNWMDRYDIRLNYQAMPDLNFDLDMRQALDRFKLRKLMKMCELNQNRIKAAAEKGEMDEMLRLMKVQQKMQEARNELARKTGAVVLK